MNNQKFDTDGILIVIPVFNDWYSLEMLLRYLDEALNHESIKCDILVIDDASTIPAHDSFIPVKFQSIKKIHCLELKRNLGHQRAITIGLAYVEANVSCQAVIVMDGDGEDTPRDVIKLIKKCSAEGYQKVVFARRNQRSESHTFKLFYLIYKFFYKLLTGQEIRVGNFSIIPYKILRRLVVVSETWNHYAAGLLKAKVPYTEVSTRRGTRLYGQSKMHFVSLVTHGLSAISVQADIVGVRLLVASCLLIFFTIISIIAVISIKFTTDLAIPGWTSYTVGLLFIITMQALMVSISLIFLILVGRNYTSFLPQRDYHYFILGLQEIFPKS
ncbi:glycosyltransferase [Pleurocapsales cyanobacterium LEGE 06147]|nr:glycosyltransferase [Pleurocapsales cyanobacterium LEGE 06147]